MCGRAPLASKVSLEDYTEDIQRSSVVNAKFMTSKGYGPQGAKPLEMRAQPHDYQLQGLQWLSLPNPAGKILANDTGLGKTLQALATAAALPNRPNGARQVLVVVPCQVLQNRFNETNKAGLPPLNRPPPGPPAPPSVGSGEATSSSNSDNDEGSGDEHVSGGSSARTPSGSPLPPSCGDSPNGHGPPPPPSEDEDEEMEDAAAATWAGGHETN
ncbi:hypothetical protein HO173_006932 [Letharia columbiana]|uniref:SNF2 N-terminal domain-containing protein n=1 Tax=Letharia columbiana TaxID=112416 RepID=A0A8H6FUG4_9LECA|nr:uncharacterized protein HO173_006932 [Letharia columbiana]KAF6235002.1 hypothetical protein HO173_006932 [Letharia columbiana]